MKKTEVSVKGLDVLRKAAQEANATSWSDERRRDVTEALKEANDRITKATEDNNCWRPSKSSKPATWRPC